MKTEYVYDPELPFVVEDTKTGQIRARFRIADDAGDFTGEFPPGCHRVIDTTPKPKIPQDARWVTWLDSWGMRCYAGWADDNVWIADSGDTLSISDLLDDIGDAEVIVLVPKETS